MKRILKVIIPLICVAIVVVTFYMIFDIKNKVEEANYGTNDIEVNEVEGKPTIDEEENIVKENTVEENTVIEDNDTNTFNNTITSNTTIKEEVSEEEDAYSKSKLDEAKSLVQKAWGEDDTVYFTNEGLNSEGLYMVAARDKTSTAVKNYFKVNLDTKKVQVDY